MHKLFPSRRRAAALINRILFFDQSEKPSRRREGLMRVVQVSRSPVSHEIQEDRDRERKIRRSNRTSAEASPRPYDEADARVIQLSPNDQLLSRHGGRRDRPRHVRLINVTHAWDAHAKITVRYHVTDLCQRRALCTRVADDRDGIISSCKYTARARGITRLRACDNYKIT